MTDKALADFFESVAHSVADQKAAANWVKGEFSARLNAEGISADKARVRPQQIAALINLVGTGEINLGTAKKLFDEFWTAPRTIETSVYEEVKVRDEISAIVKSRGLGQVSDTEQLEKLVDDVLAANPKSVAEFRAGKDKAVNALVGQVMKASRGKANPAQVSALLRRKLGG